MMFPRFPVLSFPILRFGPTFSSPAFSASPAEDAKTPENRVKCDTALKTVSFVAQFQFPDFTVKLSRKRLQHGARRSLSSLYAADVGAQQLTHRLPLLLSIDGTDRRTNGRPIVSTELRLITDRQTQDHGYYPC